MPAEYDGASLDTAYDYRYILDVLERVECDDVTFQLDTPVSAGLIVPAEQSEYDDYVCLIMPLRLTD